MGPLQNLMGPRILKLISTLEQNSHEIWIEIYIGPSQK